MVFVRVVSAQRHVSEIRRFRSSFAGPRHCHDWFGQHFPATIVIGALTSIAERLQHLSAITRPPNGSALVIPFAGD